MFNTYTLYTKFSPALNTQYLGQYPEALADLEGGMGAHAPPLKSPPNFFLDINLLKLIYSVIINMPFQYNIANSMTRLMSKKL
jgi:hypothetical protein